MKRSRIRVAIVDDEPPARRLIAKLLSGDPDIEVVAQAGTIAEAEQAIADQRPDLVFLDIRVPGGDGLSLLRGIPEAERPVTILVTSFREYAVSAFELHADDYVMKPFTKERFREALARGKARVLRRRDDVLAPRLNRLMRYWKYADLAGDEAAGAPDGEYLKRLFVRRGSVTQAIDVDGIDWFRSADHYVEVFAGDRSHLVYESIGKLEAKLDPRRFVRIHRTTIVNLDAVHEVCRDRGYHAVLRSGRRLKVSTSRRDVLERLLLESSASESRAAESEAPGPPA